MTVRTVTLDLPSPLYNRLKHRADQARRTVEDELIQVVATAVPVGDELPADLDEAILSPSRLVGRQKKIICGQQFPLWEFCSSASA